MSGHSHASTVKRRKEAVDAKKGAAFSKVSRLITIAVKEGGGIGDPEKNSRLKLALEKARSINMPKDNINRAIERGLGKGEGAFLESISYEGFGPAGVAVIVECISDNKNRTSSEIKSIFTSSNGRMAEPGSASHFFKKSGLLEVVKNSDKDEQMLKLIDLGAEDIYETDDTFLVYVASEKLMEFKEILSREQFTVIQANLVMKPINKLPVSPDDLDRVKKFIDKLENHDDVQKVYVNI